MKENRTTTTSTSKVAKEKREHEKCSQEAQIKPTGQKETVQSTPLFQHHRVMKLKRPVDVNGRIQDRPVVDHVQGGHASSRHSQTSIRHRNHRSPHFRISFKYEVLKNQICICGHQPRVVVERVKHNFVSACPAADGKRFRRCCRPCDLVVTRQNDAVAIKRVHGLADRLRKKQEIASK